MYTPQWALFCSTALCCTKEMSKVTEVFDLTHLTSEKMDYQGHNIAEFVLQLLQRYHWVTGIDFSCCSLGAVIWKLKVWQSHQTSLRKALKAPVLRNHVHAHLVLVPLFWPGHCISPSVGHTHLVLKPQQQYLDSCCFWRNALLWCSKFSASATGGHSASFLPFPPSLGAAAGFWHSPPFLQNRILAFNKRSLAGCLALLNMSEYVILVNLCLIVQVLPR